MSIAADVIREAVAAMGGAPAAGSPPPPEVGAATAAGVAAAPFIVVGEPRPGEPRNARTDPQTGLRFYTWQGRELPSVTTVRRLAGIPHGLHQWAINQVIARATTNIWTLVKMLTRRRRARERVLEKNRVEEAGKWLRRAATEERDAAAELGTAVHDAAAQMFDPDSVDPAVRPRLLQFRAWLATARPEILGTEFQVFNLTAGYAGTADLLVRLADGSIWLIDLKTGKGTYSEHALQLIDYRTAEFVGVDDVVDERLTALLHQCSGMAVLHLADDHWEFRAIRFDQDTIDASRGLLRFAVWMHQHRSIDDVTVAVRRSAEAREALITAAQELTGEPWPPVVRMVEAVIPPADPIEDVPWLA